MERLEFLQPVVVSPPVLLSVVVQLRIRIVHIGTKSFAAECKIDVVGPLAPASFCSSVSSRKLNLMLGTSPEEGSLV